MNEEECLKKPIDEKSMDMRDSHLDLFKDLLKYIFEGKIDEMEFGNQRSIDQKTQFI